MMSMKKYQSHYELLTNIHEYVRNLTMSEGIAEGSVVGMTLGSALGCKDGLLDGYHQGGQRQR